MTMAKEKREVYRESESGNGGDDFREHLVTGKERVEFQIILLNGLDSVRRGITDSKDGGCSALLALWSVLPSKIRNQFPDLPAEVNFQNRVQYRFETKYKRMTFHNKAQTHRWFNPATCQYEDKVDREAYSHTKLVPKSREIVCFDLKPIQYQRSFVMERLVQICDALDKAGILWKGRWELTGGLD